MHSLYQIFITYAEGAAVEVRAYGQRPYILEGGEPAPIGDPMSETTTPEGFEAAWEAANGEPIPAGTMDKLKATALYILDPTE